MTVARRDDAMDIGDWLRELALPEYEAVFRANAVDPRRLVIDFGRHPSRHRSCERTHARKVAVAIVQRTGLWPTTGSKNYRDRRPNLPCISCVAKRSYPPDRL